MAAEMLMVDERAMILERVATVMRGVFSVPEAIITRNTSSLDIDGWDSLSHALLILGIEEEFGIELPLEKTYELNDVGGLVDLIAETKGHLAAP